ncbi:hypothetical protein [Winogradskyella sp. 3972H.M.0a.05]|uniref:hypothetical protein n=1 Tax=Winogradskyella sp. 3972H.M.0a.05 TaxID=2950277 RepID=UPI003396EC72
MISPSYSNHAKELKIQIFKTNIKAESDLNTLKPLLDSISYIIKWSIDLEDIDKVLKIESHESLSEEDIINLVKSRGYYCEELV